MFRQICSTAKSQRRSFRKEGSKADQQNPPKFLKRIHKLMLICRQKLHTEALILKDFAVLDQSLSLSWIEGRRTTEELQSYEVQQTKEIMLLNFACFRVKVRLMGRHFLIHEIPTAHFVKQWLHQCQPCFSSCKQRDACQDSLLPITHTLFPTPMRIYPLWSSIHLSVSHLKTSLWFLNVVLPVQITEQSLPHASSWQEMQLSTGCKNPPLEKQTTALVNRSWGARSVSAHSDCPCQHSMWPAINSPLHLWFRATPHPCSQFSMFLSSVFQGIDPGQEFRPDPWTALLPLSNQQLSYTQCELLPTQEHQTATYLSYPPPRSAIWPNPYSVNKLIPRTSNF